LPFREWIVRIWHYLPLRHPQGMESSAYCAVFAMGCVIESAAVAGCAGVL
jgi:hypothetical protein